MIKNIYEGDYRKLIIFPLILVLLSSYFIQYVKLGMDFTGGTRIVLDLKESINPVMLKEKLEKQGMSNSVRVYNTSFGEKAEIEFLLNPSLLKADELKDSFNAKLDEVAFLEARASVNSSFFEEYLKKRKEINNISNSLFILAEKDIHAEDIQNLNTLKTEVLKSYSAVYSNYEKLISKSIAEHVKYSSLSIENVSPTLSVHFLESAITVGLVAALLATGLVFIFFRTLVPSLAIICGAFCDIVIALGVMGLFGIPLTLASFAALLMLLGFSLDTDILLTMRMLKRAGDIREKAFDAMKTGMTMSITAIFAFLVLFAIGLYTHISIYSEISSVALAGLFGDLFATWGLNAVILLYHCEGKI